MKHIGWFIIIWAMLLGFSLQLKAQRISVGTNTRGGGRKLPCGLYHQYT